MIKLLFAFTSLMLLVSCSSKITIAEIDKPTPNYTFTNIINSPDQEISLSDLKGKIVILEFWATWCGPCIPAMKKLDRLQAAYRNDIKVLAISAESNQRLKKYVKSSDTNLTVLSDTAHQSIFKYKTIPHAILIDKDGEIRAITSPENITSDIIDKLIAQNEIEVPMKDDFYVDPTLDIETISSVANSSFRVELKSYDQQKRGGTKLLKDLDGSIHGIEIWNSPIPRMYQSLFEVASPGRMVFRDGLSYDDFPYEPAHQYNLTIEVSQDNRDQWRNMAIDFLNNHFPVNAKMTSEPKDCYVLIKKENLLKESMAPDTEFMFMGTILKSKKIKMSRLSDYLENFKSIPVIDQTGLDGEYDIELDWQAEDPYTLDGELKKYGLALVKAEKPLPVDVMEIYKKELKN